MKRNLAKEYTRILDFISDQTAKVEAETTELKTESVGVVESAGDGVAMVRGLYKVMYNELLLFPKKTFGLAVNLEENRIGTIILGEHKHIKEGDLVHTTGRLLSVPVGNAFIGRVIDPLGFPLDGKPKPKETEFYPLERLAPGVIEREPVHVPLQTGVKAIDSMIPIGRGQRELIIGDRGTGKSSLPITTIINQKGSGVVCIYVVIGQRASFVAKLVSILEQFDALDHTIIVAATAADPATLQYIAPYAGCALGEYFAYNGRDALVIYDDLTKHAWSYRELSLLLHRPSGREAYPGDIFYLHSRVLERACKLNKKRGGGSLTALPIVETQAGDLSSYIPTNIISITDGQIYLEPDLFYAGVRPAINVGLSVSRVGGAAQAKAMKRVAGKLRLDLAQYRELAAFAQFASDLDPKTQSQLERGARITEILKQGWDEPAPLEHQVVIIWAATNGFLDPVKKDQCRQWERLFIQYLDTAHPEILEHLRQIPEMTGELEDELTKAATTFNAIESGLMLEEE
ncbi:MAG: F0F1 ATP synthase subunit alpha [Candidatus Chisholmbacteria bacterium RIFCSPLOWO2_01_FULL_50_28]|uniref:ATP synthase subunit alpha n=1 Tax=Candidatus Chisholmbacteria bacterium RIFCSPHIGHO2_01_FULL_52_32 TaxID=1797591 RepID=A0A1G1VSL0_9BACT|nr:MAG: F0F1 ATP synthase subunit alpha [Candidatus Chisholmbacteria bacterium RIFCSPHIGHO2_01_FULL_52_32]OGY20236.1 MAG: F0F1 ATP synthase subunit alpha [Candidatus Chisholmbacteria bacterium RIFCSPLOWO2_01_FULL_50_28]